MSARHYVRKDAPAFFHHVFSFIILCIITIKALILSATATVVFDDLRVQIKYKNF